MKKTIYTLLVFSSAFAIAQTGKTGINTTAPTATLDVKSITGNTTSATNNLKLENGAGTELMTVQDDGAIHLPLVNANANNTDFLSLNSATGMIEKTKNYKIVNSGTIEASTYKDVAVAYNYETNGDNYDLGLTLPTITVPKGKKYGIAVFYSVPMGVVSGSYQKSDGTTGNAGNFVDTTVSTITNASTTPITYTNTTYRYPTQLGGYWGATFKKNGTEVQGGSRKLSVPARVDSSVQMSTVANNYFDIIDNTTGTVDQSITYSVLAYIEHHFETTATYQYFRNAGGTVRFNMYASSGLNYNWGKGSISYIAYELP